MKSKILRWPLLVAALAIAVTACQEELTTPGSCPATCPGGTPIVHDTILDAIYEQDSTYTGYIGRGAGNAGLRVSNGFLSDTDYAVIRFGALPDSLGITSDTLQHAYTIDSAIITISILARDTTASGVLLAMHRLPALTDSTADFAAIDPFITPATIVDSVTIADSIRAPRTYKFVFKGDTLGDIAIPPGDSGVLAIAVAITAPTSTGVRIGGPGSGNFGALPNLQYFVTVDTDDTTTANKKQTFSRPPRIATFVSSSPTPVDDDLLTIGTIDAARSLIRFEWPAYLRDSALLARATLELTPADTITGLPGDSNWVSVYGIQNDFGAKSVPTGLRGERALIFGSIDTVRIDVISEVIAWQTGLLAIPHAPALMIQLRMDGGSFTEPRFRSSRPPGGGAPRLHVTYQLPFDFERP